MITPGLLIPALVRLRAFLPAVAPLLWLLAPHAHGAPGDLDATFGSGGKVTTPIGSSEDRGYSVAVQSDGKILVAGSSKSASGITEFALVRYTSTGALDTSFNGTGKLTTDLGGGEGGRSVAVQSDGRILVAGSSINGSNSDFALVRYTSTGALDTSFNGTGKVTTDIQGESNDWGQSVAVQSDGKIVVVGFFSVGGLSWGCALVRYTSTGALDTSFNGGGRVITYFSSSYDMCAGVAVQSDDRIVVAGRAPIAEGESKFALVRYTGTGALDASFNGGGVLTTHTVGYNSDGAGSVVVQSDGKILAAGVSLKSGNAKIALVRCTSTGTLDTSFNGTGTVVTSISESSFDLASSVAVQSDGKILVAGTSQKPPVVDFALVRYTSTGTLDTSFNRTGKVTTPVGSGSDWGQSVAVQSDGRIVVAGYSSNGSDDDFALVRYEGGSGDPDLDDDGLLDSWEFTHFGSTNVTSALGDVDHDGRVDLLELAFGGDPFVSDPGATPAVIVEDGYLTTTITKQPGVTYLVQTARTLDAAFSATSTTVLTETATTLKVRDNVQVGDQPARFLRVKVTAAP